MKIVYLIYHKNTNRPAAVAFTPNGVKKHITKMIRKKQVTYGTGTQAAQIRRLRDDFIGADAIKTVNKRLRPAWIVEEYVEGFIRR